MINIAEILKNFSKGTKLYSPAFGEVTYILINDYKENCILIRDKNGDDYSLNKFGQLTENGECVLFLSKDNRNWNTPFLDFKDGDIITIENGDAFKYISIYKKQDCDKIAYYVAYNCKTEELFVPQFNLVIFNTNKLEFRKATNYEKSLLISELKKNKMGFDLSKKNLFSYKHFITNAKPFDKIIWKYNDLDIWKAGFVGNVTSNSIPTDNNIIPMGVKNTSVKNIKILPYNEDTKHLIGTYTYVIG